MPQSPESHADRETTRRWTFLTNHGHVLVFLSQTPDARIRDVAQHVGISERAAQGILTELEGEGYVTKQRVGRRNKYRIHPEERFRHPAESNRPVGDLLKIFRECAPGPAATE